MRKVQRFTTSPACNVPLWDDFASDKRMLDGRAMNSAVKVREVWRIFGTDHVSNFGHRFTQCPADVTLKKSARVPITEVAANRYRFSIAVTHEKYKDLDMTRTIDTAYTRPTPLSIRMASVIFPVLVEHAKKRQLITYGGLAGQARHAHPDNREVQHMIPVSMGRKLDVVRTYCLKNQLPDLASIAINQETRNTGLSYVDKLNAPKRQQEVFTFDWESRAVEFDEHLVQENRRTKKLVKRREDVARKVMREYYVAHKPDLPADIVNYREQILVHLGNGHDAEDAFEMALRT
ncbi:hypothetical protein BZM27_06355 [Paraburkholderia steynii]|uniref:Uncharacterized protein n=1 Tax=Paraburkholderia steynii TaxID=1245441 RepID=A0A4R0XFH3_9BURK|nr:hypothetical protein BZM27_06355 [Paraburkholderia steynii]